MKRSLEKIPELVEKNEDQEAIPEPFNECASFTTFGLELGSSELVLNTLTDPILEDMKQFENSTVEEVEKKEDQRAIPEPIFNEVSASNIFANLSLIPMLNDTNFKTWKENVMIVLGCMDLDLALRKNPPTVLTAESSAEQKRYNEKWEQSNRISIMIMKHSIPEIMRDSLPNEENAKAFLAALEKLYIKNEKVEIINTLRKLISMKYSGKGNIRKYIMQMSHLAYKLNELKLEISEDMLVALVLISLPAQYGNLKTIYNTQKEKWNLIELISICVQEEEMIKGEKPKSAKLATNSKANKRKKTMDKGVLVGTSQYKVRKKQDEEFTCFFYKKAGHLKKECPKFANWRIKKGLSKKLSTK